MTHEKKHALSQLRCQGCSRPPTEAEVDEMLGDFGYKLGPKETGAYFIWFCLACCNARKASDAPSPR